MPSYLAFYEQSFFTTFRELHNKNIKECRNCEMKSEREWINQSLSLEWVASKAYYSARAMNRMLRKHLSCLSRFDRAAPLPLIEMSTCTRICFSNEE